MYRDLGNLVKAETAVAVMMDMIEMNYLSAVETTDGCPMTGRIAHGMDGRTGTTGKTLIGDLLTARAADASESL